MKVVMFVFAAAVALTAPVWAAPQSAASDSLSITVRHFVADISPETYLNTCKGGLMIIFR